MDSEAKARKVTSLDTYESSTSISVGYKVITLITELVWLWKQKSWFIDYELVRVGSSDCLECPQRMVSSISCVSDSVGLQ